ncbi:MAG: DsbA family protein [Yoonia sp.]|jgi:protein-disulfide isomerase|nr:DsbA family protein [Yoonia sp.]
MQRRNLILGGAAVVGLGGYALTRKTTDLPFDPMMAANAQEATGETMEIADMVMGSADAPVEIIEYASFTCPHCASFHADTFKKLKADYIDTGKVRFVYREVYFDRFGLWASMIARCGGEMRFFGMAELIYEKQREWTSSGDPAIIIEDLRKLAKTAGLTDDMLDECMNDADMAQSLVGWYQANAERDDISSTPSFLIDGEKYSNMAYAEFQKIIDDKVNG